jgi:diguanylate cyclase (GGDEF)-like protein/PAS domain S-box-containing protein
VSLRANTYVALAGAALFAVALVFTATIYAGRIWVHSAERIVAAADMRQAGREFIAELRSIDSVAHDWGSWTEAFRFVEGKNPGFIRSNDPQAQIAQDGVDALVITDIHGNWLMQAFSPQMSEDKAAQTALRAAMVPGGRLLMNAEGNPSMGVSGIVDAGDESLLVAARPVVSSGETLPIGGTIVLARVVNPALLRRIGAVAGVKLDATPAHSSALAPDTRRAVFDLPSTDPIYVSVRRPLDISAFLRLDGLDGQPALILSSPVSPIDYDIAMRTLAALIGAILLGGLLWAMLAYQAVDTTSLSRMTWLRDAVAQIKDAGTLSARIAVPPGAGDEAATVGGEVNAMLEALEISEQAAWASEQQRRVLVDNMADAVLTADADGVLTFGNPEAARLTGYPADELAGMHYQAIIADESASMVAALLDSVNRGGGRPVSAMFVDRLGKTCPIELSISPVRNEDGGLVATTWIARDVTERRAFEDQLVRLANHDYLTGLYNRRRFEEEVAQHLEETRRHGGIGALLWIDLDRFKDVNDNFGHRTGDELLMHVAAALRERSRSDHILARIGGDEFAMLLPGADEAEALQAADRILSELDSAVVAFDSHSVKVSASIGVALYPTQATSVDELLVRADVAMYRAKECGRGRTCVFSPDEAWPHVLAERRVWEGLLHDAIDRDGFVAYAQPIADLHTGHVAGYEMLVRMTADDGTVIVPGQFLDAAEDLGLITQIDRAMVRRTVELAKTAWIRDSGMKLFINLSAKTLADPGFFNFVRSQLDEHGVDPAQLGFELTETALVANMARAHALIGRLRELGCSFALDDFGSGFSSITYLRHMPVDNLKIDGSLVREMLVNQQDRHLVRAIIELARCLDISVTAEYVENESTLVLLETSGADYAQGFFIGPPIPADRIAGGDQRRKGRSA